MAIIDVNELNFEKYVLKNKNIVVVDFNAYWCGSCRMLAPILEELSEKYKSIKFFGVDIDKNENLSARFEISSIPCVVFIKNGKEIARSVGFVAKEKLEDVIRGL